MGIWIKFILLSRKPKTAIRIENLLAKTGEEFFEDTTTINTSSIQVMLAMVSFEVNIKLTPRFRIDL